MAHLRSRWSLVGATFTILLAGCGGGGSTDGATPPESESVPSPAAGSSSCLRVDAPSARPDGGATAPTDPLDTSRTYRLVFETSCGTFTVTLDDAAAPETAASLVSLARTGFLDDTVFHRILPGFVIQGGDPTQTGSGGPGYSTVDVPTADARYSKGVVAMAKTADEPPGTSGSQFFVVTGDDIGLPPDYAIVGAVTDGLEVVETIGEQGDPATEQPLQPIVVRTVTVEEGP